jgi:hypothetical protein
MVKTKSLPRDIAHQIDQTVTPRSFRRNSRMPSPFSSELQGSACADEMSDPVNYCWVNNKLVKIEEAADS